MLCDNYKYKFKYEYEYKNTNTQHYYNYCLLAEENLLCDNCSRPLAQTFHVADARKQMRFRQNINKPRKKLQISGNIVAEQDMKERKNIKEPMQKIDNRRIYNLLLTLPTFFRHFVMNLSE